MKSLETRIKRLEGERRQGEDVLAVIFVTFVSAKDGHPEGQELYGYRWAIDGQEPIETIRRQGESDVELIERAKLTAKPLGGIVPLHELRL